MYRQSNIPWEDKKPLPPKYCTVFSMLKTPYYPEEKEFYEKNHKEDDPLKGLIIVFYNPSTGKATYAIPDRYGYIHGNEWDPNEEYEVKENDIMQEIGIQDGRFGRVSLNKQLRKKGYRQAYVERQEVMIDGRSCLMLRVYTQYCRILKARPEPDTLRENYRIIICRDECWEETREGVKKSQWGEGGCGWNKYLKDARWYDDEFQGEQANQGEELYERTIGPAKISQYTGVWDTLVAYSQLPKKSFVYKSVPEEIKEDLEAFSPGSYHHLSAEEIKKARIGNDFIVLQFLKYNNLIERVYITKDRVYPFIENPWTDRFCSSAVSRRKEIFRIGGSLFFYADLPDGSHLKGVAALAYQIISGRKWIDEFVLTLKNASHRVYQEQALKMGWYNAASSLNHVTSKDCPDNAGLAEIIGVKGSMLKHIGDTGRVVDLVKGREELQGIIKKAQMQHICPDLTVLYNQMVNYNCNAIMEIFKHYVEHGKSFGPFMYALRKRDGDYYDKKHLLQEYCDYIEQAAYVNEIIPGSFPLFLKPSEVYDMHAQATSSYRSIRERDRLDKIAGKFTAAVKSEDYQSLCAEDEEYCIMTPQKPDDLIHEGAMLHHCVGGYIDRVADKLSKIFFLRNKKTPDTPYCTIELVGDRSSVYMNQCYNAYDKHDDNADRISFIRKWAKEKGIRIACAIAPHDFETRMQPAPAGAQDEFIYFNEDELPFG